MFDMLSVLAANLATQQQEVLLWRPARMATCHDVAGAIRKPECRMLHNSSAGPGIADNTSQDLS